MEQQKEAEINQLIEASKKLTGRQIRLSIRMLRDERTSYEAFLLPIFTGIILAVISKDFLGNILYISLCVGGIVAAILIYIKIAKINEEIQSLINEHE